MGRDLNRDLLELIQGKIQVAAQGFTDKFYLVARKGHKEREFFSLHPLYARNYECIYLSLTVAPFTHMSNLPVDSKGRFKNRSDPTTLLILRAVP